ncbi:unnamed protein product [Meloidogyne enterolobii]|uniref:Uncharacterized protein n=1 Tax=Meloidogyne enterolobii TaxID=390850 RepID=A0ACB0Z7R5_MELEN
MPSFLFFNEKKILNFFLDFSNFGTLRKSAGKIFFLTSLDRSLFLVFNFC